MAGTEKRQAVSAKSSGSFSVPKKASRTFTGGTSGFFNMPVSDICDEDMEKYDRRRPISSIVYGANALVVKPANSLSPMLVVAVLNHFGYEQLKDGLLSFPEAEGVKDVMFAIVCFYPVVLGLLQSVTWSKFTIRRSISLEYRAPKLAQV